MNAIAQGASAPTESGSHGPSIQGRAWRTLLETWRDVVRFLEIECREGAGIELQYYDIMLHVSESDGGRRMTDLADAVVMSKSGLTALVDRMEKEGLVERRRDAADRRATRVALTPEGEKRFAEVSLHHRGVVRRIFTSQVTEEEARLLLGVLARVRGRLVLDGNSPE